MRDQRSDLDIAQSIAPAAHTATVTGGGVDLLSFEAATILINVGTVTDGTHAFEVQESADNADWSAVDSADLIGEEPTVDSGSDETVHTVGYRGYKRYVRVVSTVADATAGGVYSASVVRGHARVNPATS